MHERPEKGTLVARMLAGAWRETVSSSIDLTEQQLDEITPQLLASGGGAIAWWRVRSTPLKETSSGELLQQAYRLQSLQASIHERRISKIFLALRRTGVEPLLAKGWLAASLYPDAALRPYGDVDLLVRPDQFKLAQGALGSEELSDCWVDLKKQFSELRTRSAEELFERSRILDLDGRQIRVLSLEDHLALLSIHLLKHGAWRPIWLCDIAAQIESAPSDFDWKVCLGKTPRRSKWISVAIALAERLLGADTSRVPEDLKVKLPSWMARSVIRQWSHLFPSDHLPIQAPPLMAESLRSPRTIIKATRERWPDPITATFKLNGTFDAFPRLPYQLGAFMFRSFKFVFSRIGTD